jgi:hypothetical protein
MLTRPYLAGHKLDPTYFVNPEDKTLGNVSSVPFINKVFLVVLISKNLLECTPVGCGSVPIYYYRCASANLRFPYLINPQLLPIDQAGFPNLGNESWRLPFSC